MGTQALPERLARFIKNSPPNVGVGAREIWDESLLAACEAIAARMLDDVQRLTRTEIQHRKQWNEEGAELCRVERLVIGGYREVILAYGQTGHWTEEE